MKLNNFLEYNIHKLFNTLNTNPRNINILKFQTKLYDTRSYGPHPLKNAIILYEKPNYSVPRYKKGFFFTILLAVVLLSITVQYLKL